MKPGDLVRFKQGRWGVLLSGKIGLIINVRTLHYNDHALRAVVGIRNNQESFAIDALVNGRIWAGIMWSAEDMEAIK